MSYANRYLLNRSITYPSAENIDDRFVHHLRRKRALCFQLRLVPSHALGWVTSAVTARSPLSTMPELPH